MGWQGNGTVTRTDGVRTGSQVFQDQLAAGVDVRADLLDTHANDLAAAIQASMPRNGEAAATGNWPMGGNRLTGVGTGVLAGDSVNLGQVQAQGMRWGSTAGGTANALTLALTPAITAYANGFGFEFLVASDNTEDDPTIAVNGLAELPLESSVGTGVLAREMRAGSLLRGVVVGVGGTPSVVVTSGLTIEAPLPRGYIDGFQTSNAADADHDITIGVGSARANGDVRNIVLASAITKRIDATWAVGTGNGGLDTGAVGNSSWYHLHAIKRPDTGVVDVLFSLSATSPTMPTNYTLSRRIGAVLTDGSANILAFVQHGDEFRYKTAPALDGNGSVGTTAQLLTLSAPPNTEGIINVLIDENDESGWLLITPTDVTDVAPSGTASPLATIGWFGSLTSGTIDQVGPMGMPKPVRVDASSQVRLRAGSTLTVRLATLGWIDHRGRDA